MHIQFDRDEQDAMTCFTFDSTQDDQEQMRDIIDWLASLGIRTSKTTIRAPGGAKMICLLVNNEIKETITPKIPSPSAPKVAPKTELKVEPKVEAKVEPKVESEPESDSESEDESDDEPVVPAITQKKATPAPKSAGKK